MKEFRSATAAVAIFRCSQPGGFQSETCSRQRALVALVAVPHCSRYAQERFDFAEEESMAPGIARRDSQALERVVRFSLRAVK